MANFEKALSYVLQSEGGYVNDPDDAGGETNFGISKRSYPKEDIKNMTIDRAKEIYRKDFWEKIKGDHLQNDELAVNVFDFAVNSGVQTAVETLQTSIGVKADGIIGEKTLSSLAVIHYPDLIKRFQRERAAYYIRIVKKKPEQIKFLEGWVKRAIL